MESGESAVPSGSAAGAEPAGVGAATRGRLDLQWWLSAVVIATDQISKALIVGRLGQYESLPVIRGLVDFTYVQNAGLAYGLFNQPDSLLASYKWIATTALAVLALVGIGLYARHIRRDEWVARLGLSLILGGAIGNLADRVRLGYVVDFVDAYFGSWHFWAFNVADASITIGAIFVFFDLLFVTRRATHAPDSV